MGLQSHQTNKGGTKVPLPKSRMVGLASHFRKGKKKGWAKAQPFKEKLFSKSLRAGTKVPVPKKGGTEVPVPKRGGNKFPLPKRN